MEKRVTRRFAVLAAAACLFGIVIVTPLMAPTANADQLPNGYNVTCTGIGSNASCEVSGCPRVKGDEAGDVIHARFNAQPQREIGKGCNDSINVNTALLEQTVDASAGFTFYIQGCRRHNAGSDDCGAWSEYHFTPPKQAAPAPAPLPVKCPAGSPVASVPNGQQCPAAPAPAAPVKCPDGSMTDTVPAGQQCAAPTNAVALNITRNGLNARVVVTNNSSLLAKCTYTATKIDGVGPQEVDKSIVVGVKGSTTTINDMLWPPPFTSYNAVVKCTATYNGTQTSIGEASQKVTG
jgi:hypothetical protein